MENALNQSASPRKIAAAQEIAEVAADVGHQGLDAEVAADQVAAVAVVVVALERRLRDDDVPPGAKDVLGFGERVRVRDGSRGDGAETDARLAQPDGEVHLVAADEEAHVRQAHLEEDIGADQRTVEEVAVVRQEPHLFQRGPVVGDFAVQPEEEGEPVGMPGRHHQRNHGLQVPRLRLPDQRGEAFGVRRLGVVVHHPDPVGAAGHGLKRGKGEAAGPAKVGFRTDVVHIRMLGGDVLAGTVPLSTRQMVCHGGRLAVDGAQQDGELMGTVKRHGGNCDRHWHCGDPFSTAVGKFPAGVRPCDAKRCTRWR